MPVSIEVATIELTNLADKLRAAALRIEPDAGKAIEVVATTVAAKAKTNAAWSSTIPETIKVEPGPTNNGIPSVSVVARGTLSYLFELGHAAKRGGLLWRHPLYGNRKYWYDEKTRPYLRPALEDTLAAALKQLDITVDQLMDDELNG